FADEDMMADPNLILRAQPVVRIYRNEQLLTSIFVSNGEGLSCRVFTLDAEAADVEEDVMFYPGTRLILGSVIDAASGQPLPEAKISLTDYTRETWDMLSDQEGKFIFNVDIGEYKLDVAKPGYIGYSYLIRMGADETPREVTCALSEEIREYRIVLTWNRKPEDLDAHLTGPHPQGDIFHIWYRNKIIIAGKDFLDCDDMNGYGPETITIYEPAKGEYYYSVHDYSNRNKKRSNRLSYSNARVQVYGENRLLAAFEVPVDQKGNCWHVFKIDQGNQIVTINTIDFIADERNIR
ncbi:MAG: carboxypeptidase regulatory-like domain-containing protein, partial [Candidatus Cloacimonetes bacterium]|nr:carboxypeptidase regulatory-like domain-containing protein [Candidatus Cloacimonadota bacterium]